VLIHGGTAESDYFAIRSQSAGRKGDRDRVSHQSDFKQLGVDLAIDYRKTKFEDVIGCRCVLRLLANSTIIRRGEEGGIIVNADGPDQPALMPMVRGASIRSSPRHGETDPINRREEDDAGHIASPAVIGSGEGAR
jgi:hypothetical protein